MKKKNIQKDTFNINDVRPKRKPSSLEKEDKGVEYFINIFEMFDKAGEKIRR